MGYVYLYSYHNDNYKLRKYDSIHQVVDDDVFILSRAEPFFIIYEDR